MKVNWWTVAPYIYKNEQGQVKGIFKEIVETIVKKCCGECTDFIYDSALNPSNNSEILKSRMGKVEFETFYLCVVYSFTIPATRQH